MSTTTKTCSGCEKTVAQLHSHLEKLYCSRCFGYAIDGTLEELEATAWKDKTEDDKVVASFDKSAKQLEELAANGIAANSTWWRRDGEGS